MQKFKGALRKLCTTYMALLLLETSNIAIQKHAHELCLFGTGSMTLTISLNYSKMAGEQLDNQVYRLKTLQVW